MTQRTVAHISIWLMIVGGIFFLMNIFVVPHFTAAIADMSDGKMQLPAIIQLILNFSHLAVRYSWFFAPLYGVLFIAVIIWYCKSRPRASKA